MRPNSNARKRSTKQPIMTFKRIFLPLVIWTCSSGISGGVKAETAVNRCGEVSDVYARRDNGRGIEGRFGWIAHLQRMVAPDGHCAHAKGVRDDGVECLHDGAGALNDRHSDVFVTVEGPTLPRRWSTETRRNGWKRGNVWSEGVDKELTSGAG